MKLAKALPLAFLVFFAAQTATAQYFGFSSQFGYQKNADETINQIENRIKDIQSQSIPKNDLALTRELDRIDQEIMNANFYEQQRVAITDAKKKFDAVTAQINENRLKLTSADCTANLSTVARNLRLFNDSISQLDEFRPYLSENASNLQVSGSGRDQVELCEAIKAELMNQEFDKNFGALVNNASSALAKTISDSERISQANDKLIEELTKLRAKLRDALNNSSPQQKITADLPLILGILGGACVLAILGVKLFDDDIQMEWVASGQVIQFVTVMVLLSVIAALGLSNILQENTLGTLLGGIAGYVLAQGVGRAAARDVARNIGPPSNPKPRAETPPAT